MSGFEELATGCRGAVERYVRYKISSKADGDDILQEVWLAAFEQFDRIADESCFKVYVIGIARNKIRNYYRDRRDDVSFDDLPETELVQSRHGLVEFPAVHETIGKLSDNDRQILTLYFFENMPQNVISERLGIPVGTVKSRLNTAKRNFRNKYPYPTKGADNMIKLPKIIPEFNIFPSNMKPLLVCLTLPIKTMMRVQISEYKMTFFELLLYNRSK